MYGHGIVAEPNTDSTKLAAAAINITSISETLLVCSFPTGFSTNDQAPSARTALTHKYFAVACYGRITVMTGICIHAYAAPTGQTNSMLY